MRRPAATTTTASTMKGHRLDTGEGLAAGGPEAPDCTTMSRYAVEVKDSLSVTVRLTL
jgi:hypothetical protein